MAYHEACLYAQARERSDHSRVCRSPRLPVRRSLYYCVIVCCAKPRAVEQQCLPLGLDSTLMLASVDEGPSQMSSSGFPVCAVGMQQTPASANPRFPVPVPCHAPDGLGGAGPRHGGAVAAIPQRARVDAEDAAGHRAPLHGRAPGAAQGHRKRGEVEGQHEGAVKAVGIVCISGGIARGANMHAMQAELLLIKPEASRMLAAAGHAPWHVSAQL